MTDAVSSAAEEAAVGEKRSPIRSLTYHVILCAASIVMLYPLLWMLASSFRPEDQIFGNASTSYDAAQDRAWAAALTLVGLVFLCTIAARVVSSRFSLKHA